MSLLDQQNLLAKLYTDEEFRREFLSEPEKIGKDNFLDDREISDIKEILPGEINAFADSLFYKRLREVERFLPLTRKFSGENFEILFREFSREFNPKSVKKHLEDAFEFSGFLQKKDFESLWIKDLAKFEQARLEFSGFGKNFVFKSFDFDIRGIFSAENEMEINLKKRKTYAVWLRIGKRIKHFII